MEERKLNQNSPYKGSCIMLTTKHAKSIAIAPPFWDHLGASVIEYLVDTDKLGTFSGEVERQGNALECARRKCEWSLENLGSKVEFALASEGSFGPHPLVHFMPSDHEILYFIDRRHNFHLHLSHLSEKTNYRMQALDSWEELLKFASSVQFPSHALIIRPNDPDKKQHILKGINTSESLLEAFHELRKLSSDGKIRVETDMRAHVNPTRMAVIGELSEKLAQRLATLCPGCKIPGFGAVRVVKGLACGWCGLETDLIKTEIFGCKKCDYEEELPASHGLTKSEPTYCAYCNP